MGHHQGNPPEGVQYLEFANQKKKKIVGETSFMVSKGLYQFWVSCFKQQPSIC